jgi:TolB-like protein/tetratricopeptide (TPR) repeat protein
MASLIPGYEYDIFISYRQKDNKHDGWVTEFIDNLKGELESTFKEEISVYFDINPHDGLLETHDVNASLKEKLKCLVFIPIISRTYCDPKSFAWEHEFKAFVEQASQDQFGLKVKLPGGNVANRILPIQIHDLTTEDKTLLEKELGGVLRSIEFIYKEPVVDKPLAPEDNEKKNLNNTKYRIQIIKVAHAIKDIVLGLKAEHDPLVKGTPPIKELLNEEKKEDSRKEVISKGIIDQKSKKRIIILLSVFLFIAGAYVIYKIIDRSKQTQDLTKLEKSIAVLPFKSLSDDPEKQYLADGMMDAILLHLSKIEDLRVMSRTSVEQYRKTDKASNVIGQELGVAYLLEGSFQKYGDNARLIVQLIKTGKEGHVWAKDYDRNWNDVFSVQSEVAQTIARELHAVITPEEKQLIEKTPTANLTAYDFYQRGREEHIKYWINNSNKGVLQKEVLQKAEVLYRKALKYDSTFAQAYTGLARVYWDMHSSAKEYFSENYMDSVLILSDIALSFDNKLAEAYTIRGSYYYQIGKPEQAIKEFDEAIEFNPNDWMAYLGKGDLYYSYTNLVNSIGNYQKAASINHGPELPTLLGVIGWAYFCAGFPEKAEYYYQEELKLNGDSSVYYYSLAEDEYWLGKFNKSIDFGVKGYAIDSTNYGILELLGDNYAWLGQYEESLKYFKKWFERLKTQGALVTNLMHRIGYAYWQNGYKKEAEKCFMEQIKDCNSMIELKRPWGKGLYTYYDLAGVYAFRGEKDKAYKNLRIFNKIQRVPLWMVMLIKTDPLFKSVRNEPEFQQIIKDVEAKYQAEHERVRKWLEEQAKL